MVNQSTSTLTQLNSTDSYHYNIPLSRILLGITLYSIVVVTVVGNLLVLLAVFREKRLQTVFNYYIVNLAITDVLVAVMAMALYTTDNILGYWPLGSFMCGIWIFFDYGMTFASVFTLVIISVDRFWSVKWSIHYRNHHNKKKALIFIILVWVAMLGLWLPACLSDRLKNSQPGVCKWEPSQNREFVIVIATIGHHGTCVIMLFCLINVFIFMRKRAKVAPLCRADTSSVATEFYSQTSAVIDVNKLAPTSVSGETHGASSSTSDGKGSGHPTDFLQFPEAASHGTGVLRSHETHNIAIERRDQKVFVTLTYIILGYMICWIPFHVVFDISAVNPEAVPEVFYTITFWMTYINSTINPFLYNFSSPDFRRAFRKLLRCR